MAKSKTKAIAQSGSAKMAELMAAGRNPGLRAGSGAQSDRYIAASDAANGATGNPIFGRTTGAGSGNRGYVETSRESQLAKDLANPLYQDAARQLGIKQLNSANDLGQVLAHLNGKSSSSNSGSAASSKKSSASAADPAPEAAPTPAPAVPTSMFSWAPSDPTPAQQSWAETQTYKGLMEKPKEQGGLLPKYEYKGGMDGGANAAIDFGYQSRVHDNAYGDYTEALARTQAFEAGGVMNSAISRINFEPDNGPNIKKTLQEYMKIAKV